MFEGKIIGGLGNQMFQYAFYKFLSRESGQYFFLDTEFYGYKLHNGYELEKVFSINLKGINSHVSKKTRYPALHKLENFFFSKNIFFSKKHFYESFFDSHNFSKLVEDFYIEGYFQKYLYIDKFTTEDFVFNETLTENEKKIFSSGNTVSIHVRGGDYLLEKNKKLFGNSCNQCFYKTAVDYFLKLNPDSSFILFTNDEEYSKLILPNINYIVVNWNKGELSYRDMFLMTKCSNNIISNSTFSWWGAFLNDNPNKRVIAPKQWFKKDKGFIDSILPCDWIRV